MKEHSVVLALSIVCIFIFNYFENLSYFLRPNVFFILKKKLLEYLGKDSILEWRSLRDIRKKAMGSLM